MVTSTLNNSGNFFLTSVPLNEIGIMIRQIVREEVERMQKQELMDKYLTSKEACQIFQPAVSRVTLDKWSKENLIPKHKIGGSVYYKYSEVMEASKQLGKYKRGQL